MTAWTCDELATAVFSTMRDVLVHQRVRWGALMSHRRQYEGWWKAEFRLALDSWCWRFDLPQPTRILSEEKPRNYGIGDSAGSVDILVGCCSTQRNELSPGPRIWVEIKERGTWWNNARKGLGEANKGLRSDLLKWRDAPWSASDVVVACHILSHEAKCGSSEPIPPDWAAAFEEVSDGFPRFMPTLSVCFPCVTTEIGLIDRCASIDFFTIRRP
jgi:hypothetical protein